MKQPCPDPEGCKHFKESIKLQAQNREFRTKLDNERMTPREKDFIDLQIENKMLKKKIARIRRLQKGYEEKSSSLVILKYPAKDIAQALKGKQK